MCSSSNSYILLKEEQDRLDNLKRLYKRKRLNYLKQRVNYMPLNVCPECSSEVVYTEDEDEYYCSRCGLVTQTSIAYVAGFRVVLPYGRR